MSWKKRKKCQGPVKRSFNVTHVPLRWLRAEDETAAGRRWQEWLGQTTHDWFHRGRADNWASIRLVLLTPKKRSAAAGVNLKLF